MQCINEDVMSKKHELTGNTEEVNDAEIYDAIRYLEPVPTSDKKQNDETAFVICFCVVVLLLGFLGFMCLYCR